MPEAGVDLTPVVVKLESAPPDGWAKIRRMGYGQDLEMQRIAAKFSRQGKTERQDMEISLTTMQAFKFKTCVIDHNLTFNGKAVDLTTPEGLSLLDSSVGNELDTLIDKLNAKEDMAPFTKSSEQPSAPKAPSEVSGQA